MSEKIREKNHFPASTFRKTNGVYLRSICVFCEEEKIFTAIRWVGHICNHTGEYARKCRVCQQATAQVIHCGLQTQIMEYLANTNNGLHASICNACNFVQLDKAKMETHLRNHHDEDEKAECSDFIILSSLKFTKNSYFTAVVLGKLENIFNIFNIFD